MRDGRSGLRKQWSWRMTFIMLTIATGAITVELEKEYRIIIELLRTTMAMQSLA